MLGLKALGNERQETPVVSIVEISIKGCLPIATFEYYKESPSHQFLSRRGPWSVCPSEVGISLLEVACSCTPLIIRLASLPPPECVFGIG